MSEIEFNTGRMNIQITLQAPSGAQDSYGQQIEEWTDIATVWAEKLRQNSREFYAAQKVYAETKAVYKIHFLRGVNKLMRIKIGNRYLNLIDVDNVGERNICMILIAKEVE